MTDRNGSYIVTYTGQKFYPLDPRMNEIHIEDIAHALSHCCRYTGHVKDFYSIAEHSVRASEMVPAWLAFEALMHDTSEAYLIDVPRPLKVLPAFDHYLQIEDNLMHTIAERFNFMWPMPPEVKKSDDYMLVVEWKSLMPLTEELLTGSFFKTVQSYRGELIEPWDPKKAEKEFLFAFNRLY